MKKIVLLVAMVATVGAQAGPVNEMLRCARRVLSQGRGDVQELVSVVRGVRKAQRKLRGKRVNPQVIRRAVRNCRRIGRTRPKYYAQIAIAGLRPNDPRPMRVKLATIINNRSKAQGSLRRVVGSLIRGRNRFFGWGGLRRMKRALRQRGPRNI